MTTPARFDEANPNVVAALRQVEAETGRRIYIDGQGRLRVQRSRWRYLLPGLSFIAGVTVVQVLRLVLA